MDYRKNIENTYSSAGGKNYHDQIHQVTENAYQYIAQNRQRKFQPFIAHNHNVLEFGVGQGWNLARVVANQKSGYDLSSVGEVLNKYNIKFFQNFVDLPKSNFDVVICSHVLEHVAAPAAILDEISQLLKLDGTLILAVPHEKQRRFRKYVRGELNHHLYSWNPQTLGALVEKCGYTVHQAGLKPFGYERFMANIAAKWSAPFVFYRLGLNILRFLRPEQEIFIVAKKNQPTS